MEALKVILSAWSTVFVMLMLMVVVNGPGRLTDVDLVLTFVFGVTGAGWLFYRSQSKG